MTGRELRLYAVGDVGPHRDDPEYPYKSLIFALSAPITREADVAFCQLERILSEKPIRKYNDEVAHPDNVHQLIYAGFNLVSIAGNHHMDAGMEPFLDTMDVLKRNNIRLVGVGMDIAEARTPTVMDVKGSRVAFLAYSCVLPKGEVAYDAEINRPGCAAIYISTYYEASDWQPGTPSPRVVTKAEPRDLEAMREDVRRARAQADVVIMSLHWGVHHIPGLLAGYQFEVGRAAIDSGVDLIVGHHPHILKGIEVYKGKPIFYSLGNFAMDSPIPRRATGRWANIFRPTADPEYPTYRYRPEARRTMMVKCVICEGKIERVSYLPFMINKLGQPEPLSRGDQRSTEVYDYVRWCCEDQRLPVEFKRDGDEVVVLTC